MVAVRLLFSVARSQFCEGYGRGCGRSNGLLVPYPIRLRCSLARLYCMERMSQVNQFGLYKHGPPNYTNFRLAALVVRAASALCTLLAMEQRLVLSCLIGLVTWVLGFKQ